MTRPVCEDKLTSHCSAVSIKIKVDHVIQIAYILSTIGLIDFWRLHCDKKCISTGPSFLTQVCKINSLAMSLPSIGDALASSSSLESALSILFEPSTSLKHHLVPSLSSQLSSSSSSSSTSNTGHVKTYTELVDLSQQEISTWSLEEKADFIGGHPRIGEVSNLSALSTKEQASKATPPEVLARLEVSGKRWKAQLVESSPKH